MCLLFAMWFISGAVMMYVPFPGLAEHERLEGMPTLRAGILRVAPGHFLADERLAELRLSSIGERAVYRARYHNGREYLYYADSGEAVAPPGPDKAVANAFAFARNSQRLPSVSRGRYSLAVIDYDQWTSSSSLDRHRPLYRVDLHTPEGLRLYLSSQTGQVLRDTTASERRWNWLGANLHWIYPAALRRHGELWAQVVIGLSLLGLASIVSGALLGLWRLRLRRPYRGGRYTPYRGMMKWHHVLGLCCLLFLSTFMFSGLMSMNPWGLFSAGESYAQQAARYRGGAEPHRGDHRSDLAALRAVLAGDDFRELRWQRLGGEYYVLGYRANRDTVLLQPAAWREDGRLENHIGVAAAALMPGYRFSREVLRRHDIYYYSHHQRYRPLPVLRLRFNDPLQSWFHIDPNTGELRGRVNRVERLQRWLYNGLHSLDFLPLLNRRPLWDGLMIAMMAAGAVFSLSAVGIALGRLRSRRKRRRIGRAQSRK